jgi:hypothetical protein
MITKSDARKILEETCGEYIAVDDELAARVADGFNAILDSRSPTLREAAPPIREAVCDCLALHNAQEVAINHCFACGKPLHS